MNVELAQERIRAYWDRDPCDSGLSSRERSSREFLLARPAGELLTEFEISA